MSVATGVGTRPRADLRTFDRILAAVLMPIGPATIAVSRLIAQDDTTLGEQAASGSSAYALAGVLGVVALFTLLPGAYAALRVTRRGAPRLTAWTSAFLIPGYLGATALAAPSAAAWAAVSLGLPAETASEIGGAAYAAPGVMVPAFVFVIGHIVGTVLLAISAARARVMGLAMAIAFALSQPVHLVATITSLPWLDFLAWGTTAVCMGVLAWHVLRTPNDEWDLPPLAR